MATSPAMFAQHAHDIAQADRDRKQQKEDLEFQGKLNDLLSSRSALQTKLPTLLSPKGEKTPEYNQALDQLTQNEASLRDLFHPAKNPSALAKYGHKLTDALRITKPQATATMAVAYPRGLAQAGNIPIWGRPTVQNADGTHSSEYSVSFQDKDGLEVLVPTVVNGRFLTPDGKKPPEGSEAEKAMFRAAWDNYLKTGQNLGKFKSAADADAYSKILHSRGQTPGNVLREAEQQKKNAASDRASAEALANAAPIAPGVQATNEAAIQSNVDRQKMQDAIKNFDATFPNAPKDLRDRFINDLNERFALGVTGRSALEPHGNWELIQGTKPDPNDPTGKNRIPYSYYHDKYTNRSTSLDGTEISEDELKDFQAAPKKAGSEGKPTRAWSRDRSGRIFSLLLDPKTNQMVPGSENYDLLPPPYLTSRISIGTYHWVDEDNAIHETPEIRRTAPVLPPLGGGGQVQAPPAAPGQAASGSAPAAPAQGGAAPHARPAAPTASRPPARLIQPGTQESKNAIKDRILGYKGSSVLNHANQVYGSAVSTAALADRLAQRAQMYPNDMAEADTNFVLSLIRSEAGRVNQQEIAMLFNAGGVSEGPERWVARVGHGQLSPNLRKQLIDLVHDEKDAAYLAVQAARHGGTGAQTPEQLQNQANKTTYPGAMDIGSTYTDSDTKITYKYLGGDPLSDKSYQVVGKQ